MNQNNRSRFTNISICITGLLFCIASGFITAPLGMLGERALSATEIFGPELVVRFVVPSVLMTVATLLVVMDRYHTATLICGLAGAGFYLYSDLQFVINYQSYIGVLVNAIGIILIIAGICLNNYATDRYDENDSPYISHEILSPEIRNDVYVTDPAEVFFSPEADVSIAAQADDIIAALRAIDEREELMAIHEEDPQPDISIQLGDNNEERRDFAEQDDDIISSLRAAVSAYEKSKQENHEKAVINESKDDHVDALLALFDEPGTNKENEQIRTTVVQNLETPNQIMTDFYSGIEDIFLDKED